MSAHVIEVGTVGDGEFAFKVMPTRQRVRTDYFDLSDEFTLELVALPDHAE
jgi:hypothetical protein